ncbi:TIGR04219 family outer membrane beta-barrel protein [Oceanimonas baumannii]|uniref:TIGR04219 family outer membrane beta-barrel protein n=1 Tax=Oceanimonas baumannii TaxID=129578 RepID=UPI001D17E353|nr:TIGR04219 family outer membrane beta-barrel protein [Oceanimonas baumannii]MCC4266186.1 TIGR04219 family outer membrane beta-barrel protein [Oceanimonas baumannii]
MKQTAWALALTSTFISMQANADSLGVYAGAQAWQVNTSGEFGSNHSRADFGFEEEVQGVYYVAFEHPVPLLPNVKIRHNELAVAGNTSVSGQFSFGGVSYGNGTQLSAALDLSNTDLILYYELFDNSLFSVDFGLNVKYLDGDISVVDSHGHSGTEQLRAPLPLGYLKAELALPLTGLSAFGELNYLALDGHELSDYQAGLAYRLIDSLAMDVNVHAGYRAMGLKLDSLDNVDANLDFDGAFLGAEIHF